MADIPVEVLTFIQSANFQRLGRFRDLAKDEITTRAPKDRTYQSYEHRTIVLSGVRPEDYDIEDFELLFHKSIGKWGTLKPNHCFMIFKDDQNMDAILAQRHIKLDNHDVTVMSTRDYETNFKRYLQSQPDIQIP